MRRLRERPGAPRWTPTVGLHLTVAFFGQVPDRLLPGLTAALGGVRTPPPGRLRLDGAGTFPERGPPRVLWVGVDGDVDRLADLARGATAAADGAGVPAHNDGRPYRPHLTVGRWPAAAEPDRGLARTLGSYAGPPFDVTGWRLMRSHPGSHYETLAGWDL